MDKQLARLQLFVSSFYFFIRASNVRKKYYYIRPHLQQKLYNNFSPERVYIMSTKVHIIKSLTLNI